MDHGVVVDQLTHILTGVAPGALENVWTYGEADFGTLWLRRSRLCCCWYCVKAIRELLDYRVPVIDHSIRRSSSGLVLESWFADAIDGAACFMDTCS
jgi:hypothetical protein